MREKEKMDQSSKNQQPLQQKPMLFIVGFPRSGTSMMVQLLNLHPKFNIQHESKFIPHFYKAFRRYFIEGDYDRIYDFLYQKLNKRIRYTGEVSKENIIDILSEYGEEEIEEAYRRLILEVITNKYSLESEFIGDKTPEYMLHIPFLKKLFPQAKFLHLLRDGRDSYLSIKDLYWGPGNVYFAAKEWKKYIVAWERAKLELPAEDMLEIRYEDLLSDSKVVLSKICDFGNIEYSYTYFEKFKLKSSNSLKWENKFNMTSGEVFIFQQVCEQEIKNLGYKFREGLKMPYWKLFIPVLFFDQFWKLAMNKLYRSSLFSAK